MFGADSSDDTLWFYFPGGKQAVYPQASAGQMSGGDILDSLNDAAREFTVNIQVDGGDLIASDGQKFIGTDGTEADSFSLYDSGDSTHFTSDNPIRLGGAGKTTIDSLTVSGAVRSIFYVQDSLRIPQYAAFPATGSSGLFAADSAHDSLIAYWGGARRVIYPATGGGSMTGAVIAESLSAAARTINSQFYFTDSIDVQDAILRNDTTLISATAQNLVLGKLGGHAVTGVGNLFAGYKAGNTATGGTYNVILGWSAGDGITNADNNVYIGNEAAGDDTNSTSCVAIGQYALGLMKNNTGSIAVGSNAGYSNVGDYSTYIGYGSGRYGSGSNNVAIGAGAMGGLNGTHGYNTIIGKDAGANDSTGQYNVVVGFEAMKLNKIGNTNTAVGAQAGYSSTGLYNTFVGRGAGYSCTGDSSIFIGNRAGYNETGSLKLYIEPSDNDTANALIYGDFSANWLSINAQVRVDSLKVTGKCIVEDTLIIPLTNDKPATASVGTMLLDTTGTDTLWIYMTGAWVALWPH
jgi:hypothetical protein